MRKSITKLLALSLACVMLFALLAACGNGGSGTEGGGSAPASDGGGGSTPAGGGGSAPAGDGGGGSAPAGGDPGRTLNVGIFEDNGTLAPHGVVSNGGFLHAIRCLYEGWQDFLPDGTFIPLLVESIDTISDLNFHLNLRQGVTFSNGNDFKANDFMFSMRYSAENPRYASETAQVDWDKTAIIDDYTIDLWITSYNASFWYAISLMYILDEESFDEDTHGTNPIGTGAYQLVEYIAGSHLILEARDDYWGPRPAIERIHFWILNESSQRVNALETGLIDYSPIPIRDASYLESLGFTIEQTSAGHTWAVFFNMTEGDPLHTLASREAIMHAIDREVIRDVVQSGLGRVTVWPSGESVVDYEPRFANMSDVYTVGYDPARARALAEQEGLVGQTLRMITSGAEAANLMAELVQAQLSEIGIETTITQFDEAGYFATLQDESNFDIAFQQVAGPESRAARYLQSWPGFFRLGWYDDEREEMLDYVTAARSSMDPQAYSDNFYQALQIFHRWHPWYTLFENVIVYAHSPDIGGDHLKRVDVGGARFQWWAWN